MCCLVEACHLQASLVDHPRLLRVLNKHKKTMKTSMKEMVGLFKTVEDRMNKKFEELHTHLNNIVQEIKRKTKYFFRCPKDNRIYGKHAL